MDRPDARTKAELDAELIQALDDLVAAGRYHGEKIRESEARWAARVHESRPPYDNPSGHVEQRLDRVEQRLDRVDQRLDGVDQRLDGIEQRLGGIEQVLADMRTRMATKVELEALGDRVKQMADGYQTTQGRLDKVADLLKVRVVLP